MGRRQRPGDFFAFLAGLILIIAMQARSNGSATAITPERGPHIEVFGIRHHGPGSARSLCRALEAYAPDILLIEGPMEAEPQLPFALHDGLIPPVALLAYQTDNPARANYYPLAEFSPEYQAIRLGLRHGVTIRMMDLPKAYSLAEANYSSLDGREETTDWDGIGPGEETVDPQQPDLFAAKAPEPVQEETPASEAPSETEAEEQARSSLRGDPLGRLAESAGYTDAELFWERLFEQRQGDREEGEEPGVFQAVLELVTAAREDEERENPLPKADDPHARTRTGGPDLSHPGMQEACREAWMRKTIREAHKEGYARIAVVCGAWHAPALVSLPPATADRAILKGLKKAKVECTWVPWTYSRLANRSGYGAGVESPGYYETLWRHGQRRHLAPRWFSRVTHLLRCHDVGDTSTARTTDAVQLTDNLTALRDLSLPGLNELQDAAQAVFAGGRPTVLKLVETKMIVGEAIGEVPEDAPTLPLVKNFRRTVKSLGIPQSQEPEPFDIDLRKPKGAPRSHFLHRLQILGIDWGKPDSDRRRRDQGTFHERWTLHWDPAYEVSLVEANVWGSTISEAAEACALDRARAGNLQTVATLITQVLKADLPEAALALVNRLKDLSAKTADVLGLMKSIPALAEVLKYGTVRKLPREPVAAILHETVVRVSAGLALAVRPLAPEAANEAAAALSRMIFALSALEAGLSDSMADQGYLSRIFGALPRIADDPKAPALLSGYCARLLLDHREWSSSIVSTMMWRNLSPGSSPEDAAYWIEGFLRGSALLLLHDDTLWGIIDEWVAGLDDEAFSAAAPIVRRTFSTYPRPERRLLGEKACHGRQKNEDRPEDRQAAERERFYFDSGEIDWQKAGPALNTVESILRSQ